MHTNKTRYRHYGNIFANPVKNIPTIKCIPLLKNHIEELWVVVDKVKNNLKAEQSFSLFFEFDCPDIGTLVIRTMGYEPSKNLLSFIKKIVKNLIVWVPIYPFFHAGIGLLNFIFINYCPPIFEPRMPSIDCFTIGT